MANNCYFEMKICGEEKSVQELIQMLEHKGPFEGGYGLGRVFSLDIIPDSIKRQSNNNKSFMAVTAQGDCAWSLETALLDVKPYSLLTETARLGLVVEAFSSEPGIQFQEHIFINKGEMILDDTVDYAEHLIEGASEEEILDIMEEYHLSREELMSQVNVNGDFCVGGHDDFGQFEDLFPYLTSERKPTLDSQISNANARVSHETISHDRAAEHVKE